MFIIREPVTNTRAIKAYGFDAAATTECILADACHTVRDGDGSQATAPTECILADACHTIGDGDGGQIVTTIKSSVVDA